MGGDGRTEEAVAAAAAGGGDLEGCGCSVQVRGVTAERS